MTEFATGPMRPESQMGPSYSPPATLSANSNDANNPKTYACITCTQRKVKCDKQQPCLACTKSRLDCQYRTTPIPPRRKRKADSTNQALLDRLRDHEVLLRNAGLQFEATEGIGHEVNGSRESQSEEAVCNSDQSKHDAADGLQDKPLHQNSQELTNGARQDPFSRHGLLLPEYGGRRYYEHGLMGALGREYKQDPIDAVSPHGLGDTPRSMAQGSQHDASDILTSSVHVAPPSTHGGSPYQFPPIAMIMKYWTVFLDNVDPLTKILHVPTVHNLLNDDMASNKENIDALKYSICASAVASMTDHECSMTFGEGQLYLLSAFQSATKQALLAASFMRVPSLDLIRAYMLYMTSMLHTTDPASLWTLMGSAIRMAQSQGLHRDGAALGLGIFETEMRRRLWWYLVSLDSRLAELTGSESALPRHMDAQLPSNFNDNDLSPEMSHRSQERTGASEMTFCLSRYEVVKFVHEHNIRPGRPTPKYDENTGRLRDEFDIGELESHLGERILRFCDPIVPVQFLTTLVARSNICKLKQMTHHRRNRPDPTKARPSDIEKGITTLRIAAHNIEYDNLIHSSRSLRGFLWHVHFNFPWGAPVFVLRKLGSRSDWDGEMQSAWGQVEELFEHHPEFTNANKVMHLVIGNLMLKAWSSREAALVSSGAGLHGTPSIIQGLQATQTNFWSRHDTTGNGVANFSSAEVDFVNMGAFDMMSAADFGFVDSMFTGNDWQNWGGY